MVSFGQQFVDTNIKKDLIRKILYYQANLISVGTKVSPPQALDSLDIKFDYPNDFTGAYPVADNAITPREKITWNQFTSELFKGQVHYMILDSSNLRAISGTQNEINIKKAAEVLAKLKDDEILGALYGGAGATTVTAGAKWTSQASDPENDIVSAWNTLLSESNANMQELQKCALLVPASAYARLRTLTLIGNVQQSIEGYLKTSLGISVFPTRSTTLGASSSTDALLMVQGKMTSIHGVLSPAAARKANVPLVERERVMGLGWDYLTTQWFNTIIMQDASGTGTTYRICKISTVA